MAKITLKWEREKILFPRKSLCIKLGICICYFEFEFQNYMSEIFSHISLQKVPISSLIILSRKTLELVN